MYVIVSQRWPAEAELARDVVCPLGHVSGYSVVKALQDGQSVDERFVPQYSRAASQ